MTKKDFFILILKVFGLFSVVNALFSGLPAGFSMAVTDLDAMSLIWIFAVTIVVIGLFVALIFKSARVVELLKLDRGFDDDRIEIGNLAPADIVKIGIFIIGGLLIIDGLPDFLGHCLFAFKICDQGAGLRFARAIPVGRERRQTRDGLPADHQLWLCGGKTKDSVKGIPDNEFFFVILPLSHLVSRVYPPLRPSQEGRASV